MSLKYPCPICGTPLGYKGLCWKCRSGQERDTVLHWSPEQVKEKQDGLVRNIRRLADMEDPELTDFWKLLGYRDVTYGCDINEPYDLLVRPGLPFRKYAVPLLAEAVRRNGPNRMMALVYTDAAEEIAAYAASGFEKVEGQNSVYASYLL